MSKIGILLPSAFALAASLEGGASYGTGKYRSDYRPGSKPRTYEPTHVIQDRITNVAQLTMTHVGAGNQASGAIGCGTAGISTTNTTIGDHLFTSNCTGTLNFGVHAAGASSGSGVGGAGGGGAYGKSPIAVNTGDVLRNFVGTNTYASNGGISFWCFTSNTACTTSATVCSNLSITSTTGVCVEGGKVATSNNGGAGGSTANSVGATLFRGGTGGDYVSASGGGGGGGGPDGVGVNGTSASGITPGAGGAGDNGSGGAGGAADTNGTANVKGGGGGGGSATGTPGAGGAPGGGAGGRTFTGGTNVGARGQGIVKS